MAHNWKRLDAVWEQRHGCIHPLFMVEERKVPHLSGSAVLVRIGEQHFLFTAAHVLDELDGRSVFLAGEPRLTPIGGVTIRTAAPHGIRDDDHIDVGVMELVPECVTDEMRTEALALAALDVDERGIAGRHYLVGGYPHKWSKPRDGGIIGPTPAQFHGGAASWAHYTERGLEPDTHLLLHFDRRRTWTPSGEVVTSVSPAGMSGTGVWRVPMSGPPGAERLVAIFTDAPPHDGFLWSTRIACHLSLLAAHRPELAPVLPTRRSEALNAIGDELTLGRQTWDLLRVPQRCAFASRDVPQTYSRTRA